MNGDERVVIVHESPTTRTYWLSEDITSCEVDRLAQEVKLRDMVTARLKGKDSFDNLPSDAQSEMINFYVNIGMDNIDMTEQLTGTHDCSLAQALASVKHTRSQHLKECFQISINPARTSWSAVNNQLKPIICTIFGAEAYEMEEQR